MLSNCGAGEDSFKSLLDSKEIKPKGVNPLGNVNPKGNEPWMFIGKTDGKAEAQILGPPDGKSQFIGKDPDSGKDWGQEEKAVVEDEMVGWHHWLNGHEFEQTQGDGEGQGSLVCYGSWGRKQSNMTYWLNNNTLNNDPKAHKEWCGNSDMPKIRHKVLHLSERVKVLDLVRKGKKSSAEIPMIFGKNKCSIKLWRRKKICASFAVTSQTEKVTTTASDKCFIKMKNIQFLHSILKETTVT